MENQGSEEARDGEEENENAAEEIPGWCRGNLSSKKLKKA